MQTTIKTSYLQNIRRLSSNGIHLGLTNQNVFGLPQQNNGHVKTQFETLSEHSSKFSCIEWKTDFQRLIDEGVLHQIDNAAIANVFVRLECNNNTFKENGVLHTEHWQQFIKLLKQKKLSGKKHIVLCCDRHTTYSQSVLDTLLQLKEHLYPIPLILEFEHRSWYNANLLKVLRRIKQTVVQRDQPLLSGFHFVIPNYSSKMCYVRLLGRNLENWFSNEVSQRFMYDYKRPELLSIANTIRHLKNECDEVFVIADNKPAATALSNIFELSHLMSIE
jgi:hypothetical protein